MTLDLNRLANGPIQLTEAETATLLNLVEFLAQNKSSNSGTVLVLDPETRDLVHLVLLCGSAAIEQRCVEFRT